MAHVKNICGILLIAGVTSHLKCGPYETEVDCLTTCESDFCPKSEGQPQSCPQPDPCPAPACKCQFDYRRADNGTCIPTKHCPPFECSRPDEVYVACPPVCPDDCAHASSDGQCPISFGFIGIVLPCSPQCRCQKGHWRKNATCVAYANC